MRGGKRELCAHGAVTIPHIRETVSVEDMRDMETRIDGPTRAENTASSGATICPSKPSSELA